MDVCVNRGGGADNIVGGSYSVIGGGKVRAESRVCEFE